MSAPARDPDISMASFEQGFSSRTAGAVRTCHCGRVFYNPDPSWTWEEGEIEQLKASRATCLEWSVGCVMFEGVEYVMDCDCWRVRAVKIIKWLNAYNDQIAEYLSLERERKAAEARRAPVVREVGL